MFTVEVEGGEVEGGEEGEWLALLTTSMRDLE